MIILFRGNLEKMKILVAQADQQGVSGGRDTDIAVDGVLECVPGPFRDKIMFHAKGENVVVTAIAKPMFAGGQGRAAVGSSLCFLRMGRIAFHVFQRPCVVGGRSCSMARWSRGRL